VQGDRLAAAACYLPLTRTAELSKEYGTRHRAALGISEETDAVALVVSEESGHTSLAVDGRIESPIDESALRRRLHELVADGGARVPRTAFWTGLRARVASSLRP